MKTHYFRVPVSKWNENLAVQAAVNPENKLQGVKAAGKTEDYYLIPEGKRLSASKRLVVIVPPGDFDERELALKVARLGQWGHKSIYLIGLAREPLDDSLLLRRMATLAAYLRSSRSDTDYRLVFRENWEAALRELLKDDDRVVCLENHYTSRRWFSNKALAQHIAASLAIPVCVIQGIHLEVEDAQRWTAVREVLVWASLILALILFLIFQIRIQQAGLGALGTIIQVISLLVEIMVVVRLSSLGN